MNKHELRLVIKLGRSPSVSNPVSVFSRVVSSIIDLAGGLKRFGDSPGGFGRFGDSIGGLDRFVNLVEIGKGIVEKFQRQSSHDLLIIQKRRRSSPDFSP